MKNKLFNVIFPIWFLIIFPMSWIIVLPANYIIDSIVFLCALKVLKISSIKEMYKKCILKIWIVGFVADIIGSTILFITQLFPQNSIFEDIIRASIANPFDNIAGFLFVTFAFLVSAIVIYVLNFKYTLKKVDLDNKLKVRIAIILAIFTAPYFFFYPTNPNFLNSEENELNRVEEHIICEYVDLDNI